MDFNIKRDYCCDGIDIIDIGYEKLVYRHINKYEHSFEENERKLNRYQNIEVITIDDNGIDEHSERKRIEVITITDNNDNTVEKRNCDDVVVKRVKNKKKRQMQTTTSRSNEENSIFIDLRKPTKNCKKLLRLFGDKNRRKCVVSTDNCVQIVNNSDELLSSTESKARNGLSPVEHQNTGEYRDHSEVALDKQNTLKLLKAEYCRKKSITGNRWTTRITGYRCQYTACNYMERKMSRVISHVNVSHTRKATFKCNHCGTYFRDNKVRNKHKKTHKLSVKNSINVNIKF